MVIKDISVGDTFIYEGLTHMKVAPLMDERLLLEVITPEDDKPWRISSEDNVAIILDGDNTGRLVLICPIEEISPAGELV